MEENKGIDIIDSTHSFTVNEEVDLKTDRKFFSVSGVHTVEYRWFRVGQYKTMKEAEKAIEGLT
jgi:hypothetical protein